MEQPLLSIAIIASPTDARDFLKDCLSTLPKEAEIIVALTSQGNEEKTEFAGEQNGVRFYEYTYTGEFHFANARNAARDLCTGAWILSIDADERLLPHQHAELLALCEQMPERCDGMFMRVFGNMTAIPEAQRFEESQMQVMRLFRNRPEIRWRSCIHEVLTFDMARHALPDDDENRLRWYDTDLFIHHVGYAADKETMQRKLWRNYIGLLRQLAETPDDPHYRKLLHTILDHELLTPPNPQEQPTS